MASAHRARSGFDALLQEYLDRANLSERAFAQRAGILPQRLNMMRRRRPAKERPDAATVANWGEILGLTAEETHRLRLELALSSSPAVVQAALTDVRAQIASPSVTKAKRRRPR